MRRRPRTLSICLATIMLRITPHHMWKLLHAEDGPFRWLQTGATRRLYAADVERLRRRKGNPRTVEEPPGARAGN